MAAMPTPDERRLQYFNWIAPRYAHLTGNTTRDLFAAVLAQHDLGLTSESAVHDVAAGPGTAAAALVPWCEARGLAPRRLIVTDYVAGMVDGVAAERARHPDSALWQKVEARVANALDLSVFADGAFTHVVNNGSLSTFGTPAQQRRALAETYRTLAPGGRAVFTVFKRFPMAAVTSAAQARVKGAAWARDHPVAVNGPEYDAEGHLASMLVDAGWPADTVETAVVSSTARDATDDAGLREFLTASPPAKMAVAGWADDELARWPEALEEAMREEKERYGGFYSEFWVALARKPL